MAVAAVGVGLRSESEALELSGNGSVETFEKTFDELFFLLCGRCLLCRGFRLLGVS